MAHHLVIELLENIELAREMVQANYDELEDPEFELGYLAGLEAISDELDSNNPFFKFRQFAKSHCEFVFSLEKGIIDGKNDNAKDMRKWAFPTANRIVDELPSVENGSEEQTQLLAAIQKLLFHNPSFANAFIGTGVIEASYFDELS
ncbi:MAG: hypothetical protein FD163_2032 [Hyphomonadaceae bacterium]|nr:MAG: hypothetical protein FD128_2055 [Hyphomonadaceae bacterium]KAF0183838.1 MAG: hypothetical protein FD163_2032 [Hyphomonadaceae bacterium]